MILLLSQNETPHKTNNLYGFCIRLSLAMLLLAKTSNAFPSHTNIVSSSSSKIEMTATINMASDNTSAPNLTPPAVVEAVTSVHPDVVEAVEAVKEELQQQDDDVDIKPSHFVFAYGSLICKKSRAITAPTLADKEAIPVMVQGVERVWAKRTKRGMTAMGVRNKTDAKCMGVLLPVTEVELSRFDKREQGYDRYQIPLEQVEEVPFLVKKNHYDKMDYEHADVVFSNADTEDTTDNNNNNTNDATEAPDGAEHKVFVWVYVQRYDCPADEDFPIAQTYVDIIMRGCMNIDKEFARQVIKTTKGWSPEEVYGDGDNDDDINDSDDEDEEEENAKQSDYCQNLAKLKLENEETKQGDEDDADNTKEGATWVDDREDPIYMRADPVYSEKKADMIDQLLEDHIPEHLDNRESVAEEEIIE